MSLFTSIQARLIPGGIPLAWRQLSGDKKRFATALAGVAFGVVLMLFQLGIFQAFMAMVIRPIESMRGDLMIISRSYEYFMCTGLFPERRLQQAAADPEVEALFPVAVDFPRWRNPDNGANVEAAMIGIHAGRNPFLIPEVAARSDVLATPDGLLFDDQSSPDFGDVAGLMARAGVVNTEINMQRVRVLGTFSMGQTLAAYGHVIVGMETFLRLTDRSSGLINIGLIELRPGSDPAAAAERITRLLPDDVEIISRREMCRREQVYWQDRTPLGFIVTAGMIIAMFVGAVIVYQILYTDINDHLKEYATLKAIGLSGGYFFQFILSESLILLIIGFIPGLLLAAGLFHLAETDAGLPTRLTLPDTLLVLGLSAVMCIVAGLLATRRLRSADPADIF